MHQYIPVALDSPTETNEAPLHNNSNLQQEQDDQQQQLVNNSGDCSSSNSSCSNYDLHRDRGDEHPSSPGYYYDRVSKSSASSTASPISGDEHSVMVVVSPSSSAAQTAVACSCSGSSVADAGTILSKEKLHPAVCSSLTLLVVVPLVWRCASSVVCNNYYLFMIFMFFET